MESNAFTERLTEFGLTRQEAGIYECLLCEGKITGYEAAKLLGISRSNAYGSLASMTEKGAVYLAEEGTAKKYIPVPLEEFCKNCIRRLEETKVWLAENKPSEKSHVEGYVTIEGAKNILDMARNLLSRVEYRVYITCTRNYLLLFLNEIELLIKAGKRVVIITDQAVRYINAKIYIGGPRDTEIGIITDSKYVMTGEYGEGSLNTCLYSGQKNFVQLYKRMLANEIELLAIQEERESRLYGSEKI
ncbi:MAG: TrmB family transcriptional regulator [Dorea sp.]|nr:TrmB family transcriptional regulator [Dorea sp.]